MRVTYEYDNDPRYGWASVDLEEKTTGLVIVHSNRGSLGFRFNEREMSMEPTCICSARRRHECSCPHLDTSYWSDSVD